MRIIVLLLACFFSCGFGVANANESMISKFLFTEISNLSFQNANKFLSKPYSMDEENEKEAYYSLSSKELQSGDLLTKYSILKEKEASAYKLRLSFSGLKNCGTFIDMVKKSYGKDFTHYVDYNVNKYGFESAQGSIDFKSHRVSLFCITVIEGEGIGGLISGQKKSIQKVVERQKIECQWDGESNNFVYQIDYQNKVLRYADGVKIGETIKFNNDFIVVTKNSKDSEIILDRKSGQLNAISKKANISIYGSCKKREINNKF